MIHEANPNEPGSGWLNNLRICTGTPADRRNQFMIAAGIIAWALSYVVTNQAIANGASAWLIAIPGALAILVILIYARFLRQTDEYVRLLQYQGLALGFALGISTVTVFDALRKSGLSFDVSNDAATILLISWAVAQMFVAWRHR